MTDIELTPDPHLLESMRAVGYSFETAVADIIDNSIAAGAETIHLLASGAGEHRFSVFDDGSGMVRASAIEAMKLAARSPLDERQHSDLGRFGLGLKTASLSQCRRLTVATKTAGEVTVLCWDLDHVMATGKWMVLELSLDEARRLFGWNLLEESQHGTLVCWEQLDLLTLTEGASQADFDAGLARVRSHCELVFHRFVTGLDAPRVTMTVNGDPFEDLDPFLRRNRATQRREELLSVGGQTMRVQAFTLPFVNKLSSSDRRRALAPGSFRDSQGFYIYRAGRLVVWGTWFRLNAKSELGKLARVQVDVPNTLDHLWALDIKKSAATPPRELREALRQFAGQFVKPSSRVHNFRGRKPKEVDEVIRAWEVVVDRDSFRYEINREHPLIRQLEVGLEPQALAQFDGVLQLIESGVPIMDAYNRLSEDRASRQGEMDLDVMVEKALALRPMFADTFFTEDEFVSFVRGMEPFSTVEGFGQAYMEAVETR